MTDPLEYPLERRRFRFLFSDGVTLDAIAPADTSNLRAWILARHFGQLPTDPARRIEGVADLGPADRLPFEAAP